MLRPDGCSSESCHFILARSVRILALLVVFTVNEFSLHSGVPSSRGRQCHCPSVTVPVSLRCRAHPLTHSLAHNDGEVNASCGWSEGPAGGAPLVSAACPPRRAQPSLCLLPGHFYLVLVLHVELRGCLPLIQHLPIEDQPQCRVHRRQPALHVAGRGREQAAYARSQAGSAAARCRIRAGPC